MHTKYDQRNPFLTESRNMNMCMVQGWDKAVDTVQEKGTNGAEEGKQENKKDEKRGKKGSEAQAQSVNGMK